MKTIIDIENASAGKLKASRAEAIEIAKASDHDAVAERYVQARLDASTRDELLADQGDTITTIKTALADKTELAKSEGDRANSAEALLTESRAATNRVDGEAKAEIAELEAKAEIEITELKAEAVKIAKAADTEIASLNVRLTEQTSLAKSRRAALAEVADTATQAIADISAVTNRLLSGE